MGLGASIVVGAVLLVSGMAKIAARDRWPTEARSMGAPRWTVPVVPWLEIVLGAFLVVGWRRELVAWPVIALLVMFTGLIVFNLARGRRPLCACFGALSVRPLGWPHIARNVALIGVAVVAALV